jgi:hypothetical protein
LAWLLLLVGRLNRAFFSLYLRAVFLKKADVVREPGEVFGIMHPEGKNVHGARMKPCELI